MILDKIGLDNISRWKNIRKSIEIEILPKGVQGNFVKMCDFDQNTDFVSKYQSGFYGDHGIVFVLFIAQQLRSYCILPVHLGKIYTKLKSELWCFDSLRLRAKLKSMFCEYPSFQQAALFSSFDHHQFMTRHYQLNRDIAGKTGIRLKLSIL